MLISPIPHKVNVCLYTFGAILLTFLLFPFHLTAQTPTPTPTPTPNNITLSGYVKYETGQRVAGAIVTLKTELYEPEEPDIVSYETTIASIDERVN
jgi:hypothetical protein